ncbi:unnamed protein product [Arabidopsis thaliana]|uniref:Nucleolar pre-ribosomal-associated protein 1 n=1 Tax=Arabidopsis thaliana TaxID=3702 RepID=A0A5S9WRT2_ARATH|nr:unnamed protein product [Arabidopsis thaliana]
MAFRPSLEAKLRQLLHNICLHEFKLCSDTAKDFVKLLKGETGSDLLRLYFQSSPNFTELLEAWNLHHGKQGLSYIFSLIQTILSHPEGKSSDIGRALDQFCRLLIEKKLLDIYKALSNTKRLQNAALSLLASIVRRGPGMASEMARTFDFHGFPKQAPRRAFVEFAISFLQVGKPSLLKSILEKKQLYSQLLQGLEEDDDDTLASVLSTLKDKILVQESSLSPRLMSALFGPKTLEQLVIISEREDGGIVNELAYDVLVKVCTDPSNGLMPDAYRKGNIKRLLALMKSLKATETGYPRDLLLAIIRGRPSLASAFFDEFPYNVEDFTSPYWFSSISLAADLVSSVRMSSSFDFLNPDKPPSGGSEVHTIMKCICPRPFSQSLIARGMHHSVFLVKHGTLRFLWETLRLWDSFVTAWKLCSVDQIQASLERDIIGEVISFFPDFQVLWTVLKVSQKLSLKRKAELDIGLVDRKKRLKTSEMAVLEELASDMVIGGLGSDTNIFLEEDTGDAQLTDQEDAENEYLGIVSEIWGSEFCSKPIASVDEAEMFFQIKLLDTLGIYVRSVPNVPKGLFDVFMKFLSSSSITAVGNTLFQQCAIVRSSLSHLKGVSIGFSPLIVCILQKCVKLLNSESQAYSLPNKSAVSLYVYSSLKYILQTQVDPRPLSCLVQSVLSEVVDGSKDSLCEWLPLRVLLLFIQSLSEPFILHSGRTTCRLADTSFAATLNEIKGLMRSITPDEVGGVVNAFSSALICATPESILKNFASVMAVSWDLYGTSFSFLLSIIFLEKNFLGNLSKLSPDLFVRGLELTVSRNLREGTVDSEIDFADHSSTTETIKSKMDIPDIESLAFSRFLEQTPFPVLLTEIMSMDISCLPEFPRLTELLLLKVSQPKSDSIESDIRLILFWLFQIRSLYKVQPHPVLCQQSQICLRLMKHLFSQISELDLVSGPSADKLKRQVPQTVLSHPVVMALLESPADCDTLPRVQNVEVFSETLLTAGRLGISEIDQHILDLLASTCENFLFEESHIERKGDLRADKSIMAFKVLVERLLLVFRDKFELCVGSQSYAPLLQHSQLIQALLKFISPFKLLYLAHSMLSKTYEEELASPILSFGLDIAGGAFEMLILYSRQPAAKRRVYDFLWELEDKNYDSRIIEQVYSLACRFSTSFGLASADTCLLKVVSGIFRGGNSQHCSVHQLTVIMSQIVGRTSKDLIIHCINQASMSRAKILFYLVESSPLHLSVFGHIFFSMLSKLQGDSALITDDQFVMLLPPVILFLASVFAKLEKSCSKCLDITSLYSNILIKGFLQWPKFCSGCIFEEKYEEILLSTSEDIETMFNASLLGKAVRMFQYHFALTESPTKTDDLLKVFYSMFPHTSAGKEMLDYEIKEVDVKSVDQMFNITNRLVAKVELSRICLFPEDSCMHHLKRQAGGCVKESSPEMGSNRESLLNPLLNAFVNTWQCVVERSDGYYKGNSEREEQDKYWFLCKSLEYFILRSILKFLEGMCEELAHLDSLPFLERLMNLILRYRFKDSKTLKILREIFSFLSRGKYSYHFQDLVSHSQFTESISSLSISSSHTGEVFRPVSSILKLLIIPNLNSVRVENCCLEAPEYYLSQIEILKILGVLLCKCGKDSGIFLKDLHFRLLCSYGATPSEIDLQSYKLMHDIKLIVGEHTLNDSEDYLWGNAALKIREGLPSDGSDSDIVEDLRQSLFKENLCLDPKRCAQTVLYFPYGRTAEASDNTYIYDDPISEKCSPAIERYDPVFILRVSVQLLSMVYIEPVEFASLGLLAVAFASMSSADLGIRKLGYETLGIFVDVLESCRKNMHVTVLRLLLTYVQNGVEEQWQRIPTVSAVFSAEASLILLDSSHEHYVPIIKLLKRSSTLKLRGIPLFHDFFGSSTVNFRSQRLWVLRLVFVGLESEEDAQIYIRNSILETVMGFFSSPLADDETKGLILQVVRKSVKLHKMARHLVENCGLLSWCSSFFSMLTTKPTGDEDSRFVVVLEVITDALASRNDTEWSQRSALEGLMEISSRLYTLLGDGLVSMQENGTSVDLILQILSATLKISHKRKKNQPHFTITIEGIFQLFEAAANCDSPQVEASAEGRLDTILMSTPPVEIICMDVHRLRRFLLWGSSTALKSDLKKGSKPGECHQDTKTHTEETMVAKFLRWLLASVILGKLYSEANDSDQIVLSETKPETLPTLLEYLKKRNLQGSVTNSEHIIGEVIVYLQKHLLCRNYGVLLPSVVFALSLMVLRNGLETTGTESEGGYKVIRSLCSRISSPTEAIPVWRWSYHQDLPSERATDPKEIDELYACQELLLIFSDMLRETPRESQQTLLLGESFDMSSVFEWERVSSLSFPLLRFLPLLPQSSISLTVLPTILSFTDSGDDSLEECVNGCEADDNGEQARA